jgi:hypothetical protein
MKEVLEKEDKLLDTVGYWKELYNLELVLNISLIIVYLWLSFLSAEWYVHIINRKVYECCKEFRSYIPVANCWTKQLQHSDADIKELSVETLSFCYFIIVIVTGIILLSRNCICYVRCSMKELVWTRIQS